MGKNSETAYADIVNWEKLEESDKTKIKRVMEKFKVGCKFTDAAVAPDGSSVELAWAQEKTDVTLEMIPLDGRGVSCKFTVFTESEDEDLTFEFTL